MSCIGLCNLSIATIIPTKWSVRRQCKDLLWCPQYEKLFIQTHLKLFCSFGSHLLGNKFISELFPFGLIFFLLARHWEENQDRCTRKRARLQCCRHEVTVLDSTLPLIWSGKAHWSLLCCNYLSLFVYMTKDGILRFNTDVKNPIRTHIWLTACSSHRSCILLFSTVESSFKDFCQQRHFCPSWALTNFFFLPSVPVIGYAFSTYWHQLDCIIWDLFSLSPTYSHGFTGKCCCTFISKIHCMSHTLDTQAVTALLAG